MFENVLSAVFYPLLNLPPILAIALRYFIISVIITILYKLMTDQKFMKGLKDEIKKLQKQNFKPLPRNKSLNKFLPK